jgi:site-specific DNA-methyltransferase (adenine-specific)
MIREERIGDCRLILGDALEEAPRISHWDAMVTDPPYGIKYVHGTGGGKLARSTVFAGAKIIGDDKPFDPTPFLSDKPTILWGGNHFASRLPESSCWLIWDKREGVCTNDQADCEIAWTNIKGPARLFRHLWNGMLKKTEKGQIRVHPTQKPIAVMEWCLGFVPASTLIFDPFMGSGSTLVACAKMGRHAIGIERDPTYFDHACRRVEETYRQPDLFVAAPDREPPPPQLFDVT